MIRFRVLATIAALACGIAAAQEPPARIVYLSPNSAEASAAYLAAFRQGLREQGLVEGRDVVLELRYANRRFVDLPAIARDIVRSRPAVIVAHVTEASLAARDATGTIPIVMVGVGDPIAAGLVTNFSRPGGNITGSAGMTIETAGKTVALLSEAVPAARRIGILWNPANATYQKQMLAEAQAAAKALRLHATPYAMEDLGAIERSFAAMAKDRVDGVVVLSDPVVVAHGPRIATLAREAGLPSICGLAPYAEQGGLIAYGSNFAALSRDAAEPVARILRGARPGDLPIARPSRFELVVNGRTAKAIGIAIPPALALRADRIVE